MNTTNNASFEETLELLEASCTVSGAIKRDLASLCMRGGRRVGNADVRIAENYIMAELKKLRGQLERQPVDTTDYVPTAADGELLSVAEPVEFDCVGLPGAPGTTDDLNATLIDLGRGVEADFAAARERLVGKAVLVDHEYPFSTGHVHRRKKYAWANELGAAAFLIANDVPDGGLVTGGVGGAGGEIPAVGISYDSARTIRRASATGAANVRLRVASERRHLTSSNVIYEQPGRENEWILICAHYDGHNLAESALDNASGVAAALQLARVFANHEAGFRCGVRFIFFSLEEWGLQGSRRYVDLLSDRERNSIRCVINLDVVAGDPRLCALTGGNRETEELVQAASRHTKAAIEPIRPLLPNSDHHVFQEHGVPAMRLVRGYENPQSPVRYVLTAQDQRRLIDPQEIAETCVAAAAIALCASEASFRD